LRKRAEEASPLSVEIKISAGTGGKGARDHFLGFIMARGDQLGRQWLGFD
jgi:hypothetical protein